MNDAAPPNGHFWYRFQITYGPAIVGLLGGSLTAGYAYAVILPPIFKGISGTYSKYPSLSPPWFAEHGSLPAFLAIPLVILGLAAPFAMGLATAWLVRTRDTWGRVSAALTTAGTASFAAYVLWIGWVATLATVVVPSISDLTLFGESTKSPVEATGKPSDVLAQSYPDLRETPADDRGGLFFPKIVSDQVIGSGQGVLFGVVLSLATVGLLGFAGTFAGHWLLQRGGTRWSIAVAYGELTLSTSMTAGVLVSGLLISTRGASLFQAACLLATTALVIAGVKNRWYWLLRVAIAVTYILLLARSESLLSLTPLLGFAVVGFLWFRQRSQLIPRRAILASA